MVSAVAPPPLDAPPAVVVADSAGAAAVLDELVDPPPTELHPATNVTTAARAVRPTARDFLMDNPPRADLHTPLICRPTADRPSGAPVPPACLTCEPYEQSVDLGASTRVIVIEG
jgi:hypothetical protein